MLKRLIPPHKKKSRPVKEMGQIVKEVDALHKILQGTQPHGYALHHSQTSKEPFDFFVLHPIVRHQFEHHHMIANAKIVEMSDPRKSIEKCLSFPYRDQKEVKRFYRVTIECHIENDRGMLERVVLDLTGLAAYIAQHEIDHGKGISIYTK